MSEVIRSLVKQRLVEINGPVCLGESASYNWIDDPARFLFSLARYKFVRKMFAEYANVLEVGCADGLGGYLVSQEVGRLTSIDIDDSLVQSAIDTVGRYSKNIRYMSGNILDRDFLADERFDGIFLLDVLEHISSDDEEAFIAALCEKMTPFGSMIIGMPSLESQDYASKLSKLGHINCKTADGLKRLCERHFHSVYIFGANDELIHTGFSKMCHYRIALCSAPRCQHSESI